MSPRLNADTRERIWATLEDWHGQLARGAIVMLWRHTRSIGGIALRFLGAPPKEIVEVDGLLLTRRTLSSSRASSLR